MPANMELLSAITELLLKHYGKQGGAAANESAPPPSQSAPAAGGQGGAPASENSSDPRVVIPKAPRQPFNWRNEVSISNPGKYSPIGAQNGATAERRGMYGRFGQWYTGAPADSGTGGDAQPPPGGAPADTQNRRIWRGCFRTGGYRGSSRGEPWPWER